MQYGMQLCARKTLAMHPQGECPRRSTTVDCIRTLDELYGHVHGIVAWLLLTVLEGLDVLQAASFQRVLQQGQDADEANLQKQGARRQPTAEHVRWCLGDSKRVQASHRRALCVWQRAWALPQNQRSAVRHSGARGVE